AMRSVRLTPSSTTLNDCRNPSSTATRTMASLRRDQGTSTCSLRAPLALRIRVSRSAIGSVIDMGVPRLPTRLGEPGDLPLARQIAQAEPTHLEATIEGPRPPAERAPIVLAHGEFRRSLCFHAQTGLGHEAVPPKP